jgi:hypothetical protein
MAFWMIVDEIPQETRFYYFKKTFNANKCDKFALNISLLNSEMLAEAALPTARSSQMSRAKQVSSAKYRQRITIIS